MEVLMMKRSILLLLSLSLMATACTRFKKVIAPSLAAPATASAPTSAAPSLTGAATQAPTVNPTPDFSAMTFVEKNNLYLQLLADRQAEGAVTTTAEETYARSLEAALEGNATLADQYLEQAILLLWK